MSIFTTACNMFRPGGSPTGKSGTTYKGKKFSANFERDLFLHHHHHRHHHHKHQGLDPLIRSVSRVTTALSNISSVFQLFSFLVGCSDLISKGFGLVAFFASVKASSVCIHLSCLVCIQSVVHGVRCRLFYGHKGCSLPGVSITSFLLLQFFVSVRLSESNLHLFLTKYFYNYCIKIH
jgi:hypothetical protein